MGDEQALIDKIRDFAKEHGVTVRISLESDIYGLHKKVLAEFRKPNPEFEN